MGIQVWLLVIGVSAMTLIVWDGWRRRAALRAVSASSPVRHDAETPATHVREVATVEQATPAKSDDPDMPEAALLEEGSRIGSATRLVGKLVTSEPMLVKGRVEGALYACHHPVVISATGEVSSYLEGGAVHVDGSVTGSVKANIKLTLLARAHVEGDIEAASLECTAGAWLKTHVTHQDRPIKTA